LRTRAGTTVCCMVPSGLPKGASRPTCAGSSDRSRWCGQRRLLRWYSAFAGKLAKHERSGNQREFRALLIGYLIKNDTTSEVCDDNEG
jgi:hypothetical protein